MSDRVLEDGEFKRGPGGRPTRQEAERRHRGLIETAFRLFVEKGWEGASIDEISRQAGVAKGFIYARYPDKAKPCRTMSRKDSLRSARGCWTLR
jgi:AcrR family transcriptional regulator